MSRYSQRPLAHALTLDLDQEPVEVATTYRMAGILSFGRGLFERGPMEGSDTSYSKLTRLHTDQFVYSRLFAWEGALAVVPQGFDGYYLSHEFPTFRVDKTVATPEYLDLLARWPGFHELVAGRAKGLGVRRKRVHPDQLLAVRVPLPSLDEQHQIVRRAGGLLSTAQSLLGVHEQRAAIAPHAVDGVVQAVLDRVGTTRPIEDVAEVNPVPTRLPDETPVAFVPMAAVDEITGTITTPERRLAGEVGSGYKQFRRGDVIFARITPSMQNGKAAVVETETEFGYGSTEFHVVRPRPEVLASWLHRVVRTLAFRRHAQKHFTGTAGQQRVPADFLREVAIPVPGSVEDQAALLEEIDRVMDAGRSAERRFTLQKSRIDALRVSVMNQAFNGDL